MSDKPKMEQCIICGPVYQDAHHNGCPRQVFEPAKLRDSTVPARPDLLKALCRVVAAHDDWVEAMDGLKFDDPLHDAIEDARTTIYDHQQPDPEAKYVPALRDVADAVCKQFAAAGIAARIGSPNPAEDLHARAMLALGRPVEREHIESVACWCEPTVEHEDEDVRVIVHRRTQ